MGLDAKKSLKKKVDQWKIDFVFRFNSQPEKIKDTSSNQNRKKEKKLK